MRTFVKTWINRQLPEVRENVSILAQVTFTCSMTTIETLEKGVK